MLPLTPNGFFHIYTHANGRENLFVEEKNYRFFLDKYKQHINPIANTISYCLLPNHLHFLLMIRDENQLLQLQPVKTILEKTDHYQAFAHLLELFLSKQFANLFSSYTQAFNKVYKRRGSLFIKNFKRKQVDSELYAKQLINYIHFNPVTAGLSSSPEAWLYSSYNAIVKQRHTLVHHRYVLELFSGLDNFLYNHQQAMDGSFDY